MFHLFFILLYYAMTTIDSSSYDDVESRDSGEEWGKEEKEADCKEVRKYGEIEEKWRRGRRRLERK